MSEYNRLLRALIAAEILGVSVATLAKLRVIGGGPPYKRIGSVIVYPERQLLEWIDRLPLQSSTADGGPARAAGPGRPRRAARPETDAPEPAA